MRDIAGELARLVAGGERVALATVVQVRGSSPRPVGATMAVTAAGEAVGSISGGCVEGAVYATAQEVLDAGEPQLQTYGISDDDAFAVGLTCGGILDVLVAEPDPAVLQRLLERVADERPVALATVVGGPARRGAQLLLGSADAVGTLGVEGLDVAVTADARGMLAAGQTGMRHYGARGERRVDDVAVLVQAFTPAPRMLVFGATDYAAAVARIGAFLGFRVTVVDARPVFATPRRFPEAHEVVCRWPDAYLREELAAGRVDERTVMTVLTHDPKFDVPLLDVALRGPAAYIGAMGSRRTHDDRLRRLREAGVGPELLDRLHSPIGLDLGARTAEETAVSIAAELVQVRWGGSGRPLAAVGGAIHPAAAGPRVAGLLLAAGAGSRLGRPKALVQYDGRTLAQRGVDLLREGGCEPVLAVLGAAPDVPLTGATAVVASDWASGMGASLRAGLAALERTDATACVVALADQPLVGAAAVSRLLAAGDPDAAVATYAGRPRNPVLLSRRVWAEVAATAEGDAGARAWLRAHPERTLLVDCDGTGSPLDVDTPEDLAALMEDA